MVTRRGRAWADTLINLSISAGAAQSATDLLANAPTIDTLTAIRIVLDLEFYPVVNTLTDGIMAIDVGIGVTSLEAFAVNATPDVNVDGEYPPRGWLYIARTTAYNDVFGDTKDQWKPGALHVDIHSQRKVDKGKLFLAMSSTTVEGSGLGVRAIGRVRVLCLT